MIGIEPYHATVNIDQKRNGKTLRCSNIPKSTGFAEGYCLESTELISNHEMTWIRKTCGPVPDSHLQHSPSGVSHAVWNGDP